MTRLTDRGRRIRTLLTVAGVLVLLCGTLWGQDDDFPFGPFRMFATAPDPDGAGRDTRVEGVDSTGTTVQITESNSGIRRAEIEGRLAAYVADPAQLRWVAGAYAEHTRGSRPLREIRIVIRWHDVQDSRPTGISRDEIVARWVRP